MKAIYVTAHFKDADSIHLHLADRPKPKAGKGECLVQVHSSGVNPSDALGVLGYFPHAKIPRIPGRDFAGIIVEGDPQYIGKKVWGTGGAAGLDFDGAHAEFFTLPEAAIAELPSHLPLSEAGAQTLPYVTAYYSLIERGKMKAGETALIIGALGQVGQAAMAICKWKNISPIALVRGEESLKIARNLGWQAYDAIPPALSVDAILNTVGNVVWDESMAVLKKFGRMIVISAPEGKRDISLNLLTLYRANQEIVGINTVDLNLVQNSRFLNAMKPGFESGALKPLPTDPSTTFTLEQATQAYQKVLSHSSGKRIILKISS